MSQSPVVSALLGSRSSAIELVVAAVLLALAIELIAAAITPSFPSTNVMLWAGVALAAASLAILVRRLLVTVNVQRSFEGFFCVHRKTNELLEVPGYQYSEELTGFFQALFAENEAPKKLWEADPLSKMFEVDPETGSTKKRIAAAGQLVVEATEYFVLENLSTHLTDFFNQPAFDQSLLTELAREDVPGIVFKNRFLDTFSRPMHERAAFVESTINDKSGRRVSASYGPGGLRYSKFDLVLPKGARVGRSTDYGIEIETPKFHLTLDVDFDGFNTTLPRGFGRLYMDGLSISDLQTYQIGIVTSIRFKPLALFTRSGWQYHMWLDSFLESLESEFAKEDFFRSIAWKQAITVGRVVQRTLAEAAVKAKASDA
ncbi:MAG: hypothetical protein V4757_14550 [Pseudomonadota bacterium]